MVRAAELEHEAQRSGLNVLSAACESLQHELIGQMMAGARDDPGAGRQ